MEHGKQLYAAKKYPEAADVFIKVVSSCRCGVSAREKPCLCKDIISAIEKDSLYDELKKPCSCSAKSGRRCGNSTHLDALDSLAATYEKTDRLERSLRSATQMVNLLPREPKGYLRLGKVFRLQGLPNLAYKTYRAGIELVEKKHPNHALLPTLREQATKLKRMMGVDPVVKLPFELVCIIFRQVDLRTLCRCLSVCKTWRSVLTGKGAQELWRIQHYSWNMRAPKQQVSPKTFMRYAFFAGNQITDLSIDNCKYFGLNSAKFSFIASRCKQLKHLKLRGGWSAADAIILDDTSSIQFPSFETLYLGPGIILSERSLIQLLRTSPGIQELSIFNLISQQHNLFFEWPVLNKLKTLRLANGARKVDVDMISLIRSTPNAETVWMDDFYGWFTETPSNDDWKHVQSLFIGENMCLASVNDDSTLGFLSAIRELHLESTTRQAGRYFEKLLDKAPVLDKVQKLSVKTYDPLQKARFVSLLRPLFVSKTIEELSIMPFPFAEVDLKSEEMDWFRSDNLTSLSLTGLTVEAGRSIGSADDALVSMVNRFPNLRCLEIDKEIIQPSTLAKIVSTTSVRTIYHLSGFLMEEVTTWAAKKYGAQIINGYRPSPAQHPDRPLVQLRLAQSLRRPREK